MQRWCAALVLSAVSLPLLAQTASVTGRVTDSSGAVIAGAPVLMVNEGTNVEYRGLTNAEGYYQIPSVPPGTFA